MVSFFLVQYILYCIYLNLLSDELLSSIYCIYLNLLSGELLPDVHHDAGQLLPVDEPVPVLFRYSQHSTVT